MLAVVTGSAELKNAYVMMVMLVSNATNAVAQKIVANKVNATIKPVYANAISVSLMKIVHESYVAQMQMKLSCVMAAVNAMKT